MRFLRQERATLDRLVPGLDSELAAMSLAKLESPGNPALDAFRGSGATGLLVPVEHGGLGASAADAIRCTRAIGARSPSLAVAATMHNFSVASIVALSQRSSGFEWMLLDAVATDRLLVASAFAEGRSGQNILKPSLRAVASGKHWLISGVKRPCTLSRSADLITASVALPTDGGGTELGVAMIPATSPGLSVRPFWGTTVLAAAESDELVLDGVLVESELVVRPEIGTDADMDALQRTGLVWFTVLISAAYLGVASGLVERLLAADRGSVETRARGVVELETAMLALDSVAADLDAGRSGEDELARALFARYATQDAIARTVNLTVESLGGMAFIESPAVATLLAASQALAFHPPSRAYTAGPLCAYAAGAGLRLD